MNKIKNGFTLVELIVVITILAILGTIGFITYLGYTEDARDLVRTSDMDKIEKSLGVFVTISGKYPQPTNPETVLYSGSKVWTQGTFGDKTFTNVRIMNKIPVDPISGSEYTYSVSGHKLEYEISGVLEGETYNALNIISDTYALGGKIVKAYIIGTYNGIVSRINKGGFDYVLAVPSIVTSDLSNTNLDSIINTNELVYRNYGNIPHSFKSSSLKGEGKFEYNPNGLVVFKGLLSDLNEVQNQILLLSNLKKAYSGVVIEDEGGYIDYIQKAKIDLIEPSENIKVFACSFINFALKYHVECGGIDFITFFVTNILHFNILELPGSKINIAFQDALNGDFWFGTNGGIGHYSNGNWAIYTQSDSGLVHNNVTSISKDSDGNFWFGTHQGISQLNTSGDWLTYSNDELVSTNIQYIYTSSDGTVWIGTNNGITSYNNNAWEDYLKKSTGLSANNITTIFEDSNSNIWFGTNSKGVDKYVVEDGIGSITNFSLPNLPSKVVTYIFEDSNANIWFGTNLGLAKLSSDGVTWEQHTTSNLALLPDDKIKYIFEDSNGNIWLGTDNGAVKLSSDLSTGTHYTTPVLDGKFVKNIFEDLSNNIYLISDGGINTIDINGNVN